MAHLGLVVLALALVASGAGVALHSVGVLAPMSGAPAGAACGHDHNETGDHDNETGEQNETGEHNETADHAEALEHHAASGHNETGDDEQNETGQHDDGQACDHDDGSVNDHHDSDNDLNDTKDEAFL